MRKRQCKICNRKKNENDGKIIDKLATLGVLPGIDDTAFPVYFHIVQCTKCGRKWSYTKKRKKKLL